MPCSLKKQMIAYPKQALKANDLFWLIQVIASGSQHFEVTITTFLIVGNNLKYQEITGGRSFWNVIVFSIQII